MSDPKIPFTMSLEIDKTVYETLPTPTFLRRKSYAARDPKKVLCFIPGTVRKISVKPGQKIVRGEHLLILEAMKMQNEIASPEDGVVKQVHVTVGQMVTKGRLLVELE